MEDILVQSILSNAGAVILYVMAGIGTLISLASIVVKITKTKADDEFENSLRAKPVVGQVIGILEKFSVIKQDVDSALSKKFEEEKNKEAGQ